MGGKGQDRNSPTFPARVKTTLETQRQAAELRAAGASFRDIGRALNIDHTWARTLVIRALEEATYESADLMRKQEGQRLDRLQRAAWTAAISGDLKAIAEVRRLMERRAALFGLDFRDELAERELALAEGQARLLAEGVIRLLERLGLADDPRARAAAADMLGELEAAERNADVLEVEYVEVVGS